jgi:cytosine permease
MASSLPDYVAAAQCVPQSKRIAWYKSTAQTYAGIMLWFVFWDSVPSAGGGPAGTLAHGLGCAFLGLVLAALLCHFLYYLVPGMLGLKTGLPLYIVGTSTYGVRGGFLMPGFLMGLLQFGWLGVNAWFSALLLAAPFLKNAKGSSAHMAVGIAWVVVAAFVGLKGIRYVARVATYFPLIPMVILVVLLVSAIGGLGHFDAQKATHMAVAAADTTKATAVPLLDWKAVVAVLVTSITGFFATAGAAGTDFGMNNRDSRDVQWGGLVGIVGATVFAGGLALLIVAGAYGLGIAPVSAKPTELMNALIGPKTGNVFMYLLALAAFPPACFSSFIAANSFKTTLPKVNPFISVGIGSLISIALIVTRYADNVGDVFVLIGASFGPVCGAMAADYLLAGKKWAGPRAGFNPAGWISWLVGFAVGAAGMTAKLLHNQVPALADPLAKAAAYIPMPPVSAFVVGFVLYCILAVLGLKTRTLDMPQATQPTAEPAAV